MKWTVIQRHIREIWPKIAKHVPERTTAPGHKYEYSDELVFEAMLKMVWDDHPMRDLEGKRYPSPNPLYLRLAAMVRSRVLDMAWIAYLEDISRAERDEWAAAFERIRRNRRRSSTGKSRCPPAKSGKKPAKPERTGLSPGLAWLEILLRGLEDVCAKKASTRDASPDGSKP